MGDKLALVNEAVAVLVARRERGLDGIGAVFAIPFPPFYESAVSAIGGLIQIELPSLVPLDCIVRTSYYSRLVFQTVWPLVAYAVFALLNRLLSKAGKAIMANACIDLAFLLAFMILREWPMSGLWAIGVLIGAHLIMEGWTLIMLGSAGEQAVEKLESASA